MISGANEEELIIANARANVLLELQPKIDELKKENQELKKQLSNSHQIKKQKEFIEYLEDEIKRLEENNIYQPLQRMALETYKHNLLKYKEIIGENK